MSAAPVLPGSLNLNRKLSSWLRIHADGTVTVYTGKVELGQGIITALAQIVSEELDIDASRIRMLAASTGGSPNEAVTAGSMSVHDSGGALRQVCAEARAIYMLSAARHLQLDPVQAEKLEITDGRISAGTDAFSSYWELADDHLLACEASGQAIPKKTGVPPSRMQRIDIPDKVTGRPRFIQDMDLPGMLYGRVLHPPSAGASLQSVDLVSVNALPGVVATVRDGSFLGVIADSEYVAVKALAKLATLATWSEAPALAGMHDMPAFLRAQPLETTLTAEKAAVVAATNSGQVFEASYSRPFIAHASIGPSCAVACYQPGKLEVWTHSQGIHNLRADLATLLDLPADNISVQHVEGAGCYGHNGADDAAGDATLLARAVPGRPVQVQWTREDELGCAPYGAAMAVSLRAMVDGDGRIVEWQHDVWSTGHSMRPGRSKTPVLMVASLLEKPFEKLVAINMPLASGGGAERNSIPGYDFAQWRAVSHRSLVMPIRTSSLRSLGAHCNVFATESFMDEIAGSLGADPLAFRLKHLSDARGRAVLEKVASMSNWSGRKAGTDTEGRGMGIAFARYKNTGAWCAVVALIDAGHEVKVEKLWIAVDVGRVVNLDGVINQIEGGAIQTVSWVLKEQVKFDDTRILSKTWEDYPILKFSEVPAVDVHVIDQLEQKSIGAGEATHGPVAAAIANAVADALGVRIRTMPLSTDNITQAALA